MHLQGAVSQLEHELTDLREHSAALQATLIATRTQLDAVLAGGALPPGPLEGHSRLAGAEAAGGGSFGSARSVVSYGPEGLTSRSDMPSAKLLLRGPDLCCPPRAAPPPPQGPKVPPLHLGTVAAAPLPVAAEPMGTSSARGPVLASEEGRFLGALAFDDVTVTSGEEGGEGLAPCSSSRTMDEEREHLQAQVTVSNG